MAEDEKTIAKKARKLARKKRRKLKMVNIFEKFCVFLKKLILILKCLKKIFFRNKEKVEEERKMLR